MRTSRSAISMAARMPIMAGNWKMNTDIESATKLATDLVEQTKDLDHSKVEVCVIPPYPFLTDIKRIIDGTGIKLGAQNAFSENAGAFTGAVSAPMLKSVGCEYVLVGHSERRAIFGDSDGEINHIVERIQEANMIPVLCIGETKEEYELGLNEEICTLQLSKDLKGLSKEAVSKLVIAYEPVWAIGTGLTATPEIAQSVHAAIRKWLRRQYGNEIADGIRIQYGGSVTPESVDALMKCPDIDGALVGGASLKPDSFSRIAKFEA